jgi:hypothetical protein
VHVLSAIFHNEQGLLGENRSAVWELDWNVNCQAVGSGRPR